MRSCCPRARGFAAQDIQQLFNRVGRFPEISLQPETVACSIPRYLPSSRCDHPIDLRSFLILSPVMRTHNTERIYACQYTSYRAPMHTERMEKFERLRYAREKRFKTATAAARAMAVKASTYISHENGTRDFDDDDAKLYARRLKVPLPWLVLNIGQRPDGSADTEGDGEGSAHAGLSSVQSFRGKIPGAIPEVDASAPAPGRARSAKRKSSRSITAEPP